MVDLWFLIVRPRERLGGWTGCLTQDVSGYLGVLELPRKAVQVDLPHLGPCIRPTVEVPRLRGANRLERVVKVIRRGRLDGVELQACSGYPGPPMVRLAP